MLEGFFMSIFLHFFYHTIGHIATSTTHTYIYTHTTVINKTHLSKDRF